MDKRRGEDDRDVYWTHANAPLFDSDALLQQDTSGDQDHPSIAFDASGATWIVWENHATERCQIWLRTSRHADDSRCLSIPSDDATYPSIACRAGMTAVAYQIGSGRQSNVAVHVIPGR